MKGQKLQILIIVVMRKQLKIPKTIKHSQILNMRIVWLNLFIYHKLDVFELPEQGY